MCRIQTQSCRGSGSGPGSPRPAPAQPATSTAHPTSAASGGNMDKKRTMSNVTALFTSVDLQSSNKLIKGYHLILCLGTFCYEWFICDCCTWMCEQAVSQGWWASTLLMWSRRRRRGGVASKPCNHRGSPPTLRNWSECRYTR